MQAGRSRPGSKRATSRRPISVRRSSNNWRGPASVRMRRSACCGGSASAARRSSSTTSGPAEPGGLTGSTSRSSAAPKGSAAIFRWPFRWAPACPNCAPAIAISRTDHVLDLDLSIDGVQPADIPPLIPELAQLQHVDGAGFRHIADPDRPRTQRIAQGSRLDLTLGKGRVAQRMAVDRQRRGRTRAKCMPFTPRKTPRSGSRS